jgi:hypothetical protein
VKGTEEEMGQDEVVGAEFLGAITEDLQRTKQRAEKAIAQIPDDAQLHWAPDEESNSIAVLIRHLGGNMRSRWSDFLITDGEKPTRDRDGEFEEPASLGRKALLEEWAQGWSCLFATLSALTPADLTKTVTIRGKSLSVMEAIVQQSLHYAGHAGQIIYLAKQLTGAGWQALTIPRRRPARP